VITRDLAALVPKPAASAVAGVSFNKNHRRRLSVPQLSGSCERIYEPNEERQISFFSRKRLEKHALRTHHPLTYTKEWLCNPKGGWCAPPERVPRQSRVHQTLRLLRKVWPLRCFAHLHCGLLGRAANSTQPKSPHISRRKTS
jgi:hypothetical protein